MAPALVFGISLEAAFAFLGVWLLWRQLLSPAARGAPPTARLAPWPGSASDLLLFLLLAVGGAAIFQMAADFGMQKAGVGQTTHLVWDALAFQGGLLAGVGAFYARRAPFRSGMGEAPAGVLRSGCATFLLAIPAVFALALVWQALLERCGMPVRQQDVVALFEQIESPWLRVVFAVAALIVAPITEEIVFRAGIFRFLRGRAPRWIAIGASSLLFGAAHLVPSFRDGLAVFPPLVLLGVIFALAYERTGRIGTTMVAHALFNLNTLLMLLLGLNP